jgi:translin
LSELSQIIEEIRAEFTAKNQVRDATLNRSRELIRYCALSIRAIHRHEWEEAEKLLATARNAAVVMSADPANYHDMYQAGYTQDALKEVVEAHLVFAVVRGTPLPTPDALLVTGPTYLRGMSEAATEMRRFVLDLIRRGEVAEAEPFLDFMDEVYSHLVTVDYPDAVTDGLRRHTDVLRSVLERTRGDLTLAIRQDQMRAALLGLELNLDRHLGTQLATAADQLPLDAEAVDDVL